MRPQLPSTNGAAPATTAAGQTGTGQPAAAQGGLARARLKCRETGEELKVHYNPTQVALKKEALHLPHPQQGAPNGAAPAFINTKTRTLTFALTLEAWSTRARGATGVVEAVNLLQSWVNPTHESLDRNAPAPATIEFDWWQDPAAFVGVITSADATYSVFDHDGRPVRASVSINMSELPDDPPSHTATSGSPAAGRTSSGSGSPAAGPTSSGSGSPAAGTANTGSGAAAGGRAALVSDGDSLASIAHRHYGDPAMWRGLALANNVTDPTAVSPGQRLVIPTPAHARELAQ